MSNKTRVFNVRVVGFSAPERQMLNSIFLLSVAPARQIGYKLWNPETGTAPDMYLLDGDSESAVASWQATFASTADRTLVVGSKNTDLGVASAARPLGLKVVGAMDRLAIALNNFASSQSREPAGMDVSEPRAGGTLPTSPTSLTSPTSHASTASTASTASSASSASATSPPPKGDVGFQRTVAGLSQSMNATMSASLSSASAAASAAASTMSATHVATPNSGAMPTSMTAAAPAATVLPHVTLQPNVVPNFEKTLNEKAVTDKTVDRILNDKPERIADKAIEKTEPKIEARPVEAKSEEKSVLLPQSGATPLSPAALAAVVAPSVRPSLRVVPTQSNVGVSPLSASLPSAAASVSRIADAPMTPPPTAPVAATAPPPIPAPVAPSVAAVPAVVAAAPAPVPVAPVPVMPVTHSSPRHEEHSFRVLAVDDSPLMRTFLQNKLLPYGIQPDFASSGEEALFKISKQHFDLIFLDVMLPGMDGYDVCKMIKKNKDNSLMKVIMLTSKDKTFDKIRGTMAGCDSYLTKPVDEMKLRAIIERHTVTKK
jgi:CheY-like chemotaxis protein